MIGDEYRKFHPLSGEVLLIGMLKFLVSLILKVIMEAMTGSICLVRRALSSACFARYRRSWLVG